jgi:hypothetical protein
VGLHHEQRGTHRHPQHAVAESIRIAHIEDASAARELDARRPRLDEGDALDLEAGRFAEHAERELGAELEEAVAAEVVRRPLREHPPADRRHLHDVAERHRHVEDVFQAAAVDDGVSRTRATRSAPGG